MTWIKNTNGPVEVECAGDTYVIPSGVSDLVPRNEKAATPEFLAQLALTRHPFCLSLCDVPEPPAEEAAPEPAAEVAEGPSEAPQE